MVKIPEGWIETTLKSVCVKAEDKINVSDLTNETYISTENMLVDKGGITTATTLPTITNVSKFFPGDILFSNIRTYFKKLYLSNFTGGCSNDVLIFRANKETDNKFLFYNLSQDTFFDYTVKTSKGTKMPRGDKNAIEKFGILLPPLPEQKAIAGVLSSFDDKIELLRAENQTLEEIGQTLFKERFGKYKVGDELPNGWKWGELGEIGDQITERVKNEKERVVLSAVNSGNLVLSESYFSKQVFSEDIAKYIICNKGDFAYNPARINIGSIGRNFYWNGAVSPVYVVFRPKEKFGKYLEFIFKSERFKNHVEKYSNGSVRQALNYDGFSRFELLIPNNDILEKFNENLETFEKKIEENKKQIETLSNTRDQLLPKLMSGEVRVEF